MFLLLQGVYRHAAGKTALGLLITAAYVAQAFAVAKSLNLVFLTESLQGLGGLLLFIGGLVVVRGLLHWLDEIYAKKIAFLMKSKLRQRLFLHILHLGPPYQESYRSGGLQSVLTDGVESLEPFLTSYIPQLLVAFIGSGLIAVYIWQLDWLIGLIVLTGILITVSFPLVMGPIVGRILLDYWRSHARLNAQYIDAMQGLPTLKVFNASQRKGVELEGEAWKHYRHSMEGLTITLLDSTVVKWAGAAGAAFAAGMGAWRVAAGILPLAELFVILFLAVECFRPLNDLVMYWHRSFLGLAAGREIFAILDTAVPVDGPPPAAVRKNRPQSLPAIEFKGVSFAYAGGRRPALKNVSLKINPGETVAVVGRSGSGKSTLVNLVLRFFDPQAGAIFLDGRDIREYPLEHLRDQIAVVFQDTYLFYGTVADNLKIAQPDASAAELERAARLAQAHGFIMELPDGYQTHIGERGVRLSGGQKQRLSLARAILKDAPVLVLDEATSNVDGVSEELIQKALEGLTRNRTTIIIAHRLSTIQGADRIVVLDDCEIKEAGAHKELLAAGNIYAQLVKAQHG
ncbi:MAG TPA: ABC transporter ATP-binding protein [Methylomusa anaerophila]|nr:ABC transporter ATP-binding protein [Methylomusa anaerophila]